LEHSITLLLPDAVLDSIKVILTTEKKLDLIKWTEWQIAAVKGEKPRQAELVQNYDALWLDLRALSLNLPASDLQLIKVQSEEDWKTMRLMRQKIEAAFGIADANLVEEMVTKTKHCCQKLDADWYLAKLPSRNGEIVGEVGLVRFHADGFAWGRLQDVDVVPAFQNRGFGNLLLSSIVQLAREQGLSALCLKADSRDWPSHWYQRFGFEIVGHMNGRDI
jgi:GNAT superfamily N-acetyltransferase